MSLFLLLRACEWKFFVICLIIVGKASFLWISRVKKNFLERTPSFERRIQNLWEVRYEQFCSCKFGANNHRGWVRRSQGVFRWSHNCAFETWISIPLAEQHSVSFFRSETDRRLWKDSVPRISLLSCSLGCTSRWVIFHYESTMAYFIFNFKVFCPNRPVDELTEFQSLLFFITIWCNFRSCQSLALFYQREYGLQQEKRKIQVVRNMH